MRDVLGRLPRRYAWALLAYTALAAVLVHDWDGYVFATAARQMLEGQTPYAVAEGDPWYGYLNVADEHVQWYAYPPLPLLAMALAYAPAVLLDLPPWMGRVLLKLPAIVGTLMLARVAGAWGTRLGADPAQRSRIETGFLLNPFFVLVGPVWGMTDTALMALYLAGLLAYRQGRTAAAGVLVAAAILVKPFPALLALAVAPYLLVQQGSRPFLRFVASGAATAGLVSLPFLVADAHAYYQQAVGAHLARPPQGLTLWSLWPLDQLDAVAISTASLALMALSLLVIGVAATRLRGAGTTLVLTLAAGVAVLLWNRVVNEQYLVLVAAPMMILASVGRLDGYGRFLTRWAPNLFAATIILSGFHFLTFIPPDIALPLFGRAVDAVAHDVRMAAPGVWRTLFNALELLVPATLVALGVFGVRHMRGSWVQAHAVDPHATRHVAPTALACLLLLGLALAPVVTPGQAAPEPAFEPAFAAPQVAAFYYLWWQNPSHDPDVRYGNWGPVSQVPSMGYYTNTRGVAREHVAMMRDAGIDTAIVSYHRGELERYRVFQEEAHRQGLWVAPLIELNQVYDQAKHHPVDETGRLVGAGPGSPHGIAMYRLDPGTRLAIEQFVLDLAAQLAEPSTLRIDGRPVVLFYDSYVSGFSFHPEDQRALAETMLATIPLADIQAAFGDPTITDAQSLLAHHPQERSGFYLPGAASLWRRAHLAQHTAFWDTLRSDLEARLGPLFLVSGDAFNERAGFDSGTVKGLAGLETFDGSFIYSPSFTWGNQPNAPFEASFHAWENRNAWLAAFARSRDVLSSTGVAPAYDDTVNRPVTGFTIPAFPPGAKTFYDRSWESIRAQGIGLPAVATFNEHFEGSSIEPSREYGDQFLVATTTQRSTFAAAAAPWLAVVHERASRTSATWTEMDDTHFWGLDLVAAASRQPGIQVTAIDSQEPKAATLAIPALVLLEGGRADFTLSPAVAASLTTVATQAPVVLFGPSAAEPLRALVDPGCGAGLQAPPGPFTLVAGDSLRTSERGLDLVRAGTTYWVGQACASGAATIIKPWVDTDPFNQPWNGLHATVNAACLATALAALVPSVAPAGALATCQVPRPGA